MKLSKMVWSFKESKNYIGVGVVMLAIVNN